MRGFSRETLDIFQRVVNPVRRRLFEINAEVFEIFAIEVAVEVISAEHMPVLCIAFKMRIVH